LAEVVELLRDAGALSVGFIRHEVVSMSWMR
jgi:hypothetical protein